MGAEYVFRDVLPLELSPPLYHEELPAGATEVERLFYGISEL